MDRTRTAGIVAAVGAAVGALFYAGQLVAPSEPTLGSGVLYAVSHLAAIVGLVGLAAQGAAGSRWPGRAGVVATVATLVLLVVAELVEPLAPAAAGPLFELAPPVMGVAMTVLGVAVLGHGRWSGWRRVAPLASGLYLLAVLLPVMIALGDGVGPWYALIGWQVTLLAIGVAVTVEARAERPVPAGQAARPGRDGA